MHDPKTAAILAAVTKFSEAVDGWIRANRDEETAKALLADAEDRKKKAHAMSESCRTIAQLYDFDLNAEWTKHINQASALYHGPPRPAPDSALTSALTAQPKTKTIREHVIDAAQQAYPSPIRASAVRQQLESAFGIKTHEKTVGMTLYRLLKEGLLRRDRRDWFFVPEPERQSALTQGQGSSGDEPELFLAAAE